MEDDRGDVIGGSNTVLHDNSVAPAASLSLPSRPAHSTLAKLVSQIRSLLRSHSAVRSHQTIQQRTAITTKLSSMFTGTSTHLQAQLDAHLTVIVAFIHYAAHIECTQQLQTLCRSVITAYTQLRRIDLFVQAHLDAILLMPMNMHMSPYNVITADNTLSDAFAAQYSRQYIGIFNTFERFIQAHQAELNAHQTQVWAEFFYAFMCAMTVREDIAVTVQSLITDTLTKTIAPFIQKAVETPTSPSSLPAHTAFHLYYILLLQSQRCAQYIPVAVDTPVKANSPFASFPALTDEGMTACFEAVGVNMTLGELKKICITHSVESSPNSMDTSSSVSSAVPFNRYSLECALLRIGVMRLTQLHQYISAHKLFNGGESGKAEYDSRATTEATELCSLLTDHPLLATNEISQSLIDQSTFSLISDCWPQWQNISELDYRHYQLITIAQNIQLIQIYAQTVFNQRICSLIFSAHPIPESLSFPPRTMNISLLCSRLINDVNFYECTNIAAQFIPTIDETLQSLITTIHNHQSTVHNDSRKRKRTSPQLPLLQSWLQCSETPVEALRQVLQSDWTDNTRMSSHFSSSSINVIMQIVNILRIVASLPDEYILHSHQFRLFVVLIHLTKWIDSEYRSVQANLTSLLSWQQIISSKDTSVEHFTPSLLYHASLSARQAMCLCLHRYHIQTMTSLSEAVGKQPQLLRNLLKMTLLTYGDTTLREINCDIIKALVRMALYANKHRHNDEIFISQMQTVITQMLSKQDKTIHDGSDQHALILIAAETMNLLSTFDRSIVINEEMIRSIVKYISQQQRQAGAVSTITMTCVTALIKSNSQQSVVNDVVHSVIVPCMQTARTLICDSSTTRADILIALTLVHTVLQHSAVYKKGDDLEELTLSMMQARSLHRRDHVITQLLNRILLQAHSASERGVVGTLLNQIRHETNSFIHAIDNDRVRGALYNAISALETIIHHQLPYTSIKANIAHKVSAKRIPQNKDHHDNLIGNGDDDDDDDENDDDADEGVVMNGDSGIDREKLYERFFSHSQSEETTRIFAHIINVACITPQYITHNAQDSGTPDAIDGRILVAGCIRCLTVIISSPTLTLDSLDLTAALHAIHPIITRAQAIAAKIAPDTPPLQLRSDISLLVALFDLIYSFYSAITLHRISRLMTHIATVQNQLHSILKSIIRADANIKHPDTHSLFAERPTDITELQMLSNIPIRAYSDLSRLFVRLCTSQSYGANQTASDAHLRIRKYALSFISTYVSLLSQYGLTTNKRRLMDAAVYEYFNAINEYEMNQLYVTTTKVEQKDIIKALLKTYRQRIQYRGDK